MPSLTFHRINVPLATNAKIPVYLLTGFLGSGKTTLLRRWIHQAEFANTAVIMNEFGAIALDHVLLEKNNGSDIKVLDSGCLCCASNDPLHDSLESLYYQRLRGEVPAFERVVVETSGLANPAPLINALATNASIAAHYCFAGVITTVDALHGQHALATYPEAATQLALADRVLITKVDLADHLDLTRLQAEIQLRNPYASTLLSSHAEHNPLVSQLLRNLHAHQIPLTAAPPEIAAKVAPASSAAPGTRAFSHLLRHGIRSHAVRLHAPITWPHYAQWVSTMQRNFADQLLRAKGIALFDDGHLYAIHAVHHVFSPPQLLTAGLPMPMLRPQETGALVLITQNLSQAELASAMAELVDAAPASATRASSEHSFNARSSHATHFVSNRPPPFSNYQESAYACL